MTTQLSTHEALTTELRNASLYAALEHKYPAHFGQLIDTLWPELQCNATSAQVMTLLHEQTGKLYCALIPTAPDALLFANARLMLEQAQALQRVSPEAYVAYLDSTPRVSAAAARPPRMPVTHERTLFSDLTRATDPDRVPVVTCMQSLPVLQLAVAAPPLTQQRVLTAPVLRYSTSPAERYQALIGFSRSILTLPETGHALALHSMYADASTPSS